MTAMMKRLLLVASVLLLAAPAAGATDPLAPGRAGKTLCLAPNPKAKTCRAMISYRFGADGAVHTRSQTLVTDDDPPIVMRREDGSTLQTGRLCHRLATADIDEAQFTVDGKPADADQTRDLRNTMKRQYADLIGKQFCSTFKADGAGLKIGTAIDGKLQPDIADRAVWIDASAGYRVRP